MKRVKTIGLILAVLGLLILISFFIIGFFKPKAAGIFVETNPASAVFINGLQVGRTPYRDNKQKPGEIVVKLIPESFETPLVPFETKINLVPGVETVIRREFGETEDYSSGEIISFERLSGNENSLVIISTPDSAQVVIDGQIKAYTPYKASTITAGDHSISITSVGYVDKSFKVKTRQGYKLTAIINLQKSHDTPTPTPSPEEEVKNKVMIEILATPVGFLRVRAEPSTLADEVGQVKPNQKFPLIEEDRNTGWYKIEFLPSQGGSETKVGWVSNQYAKKIEESSREGSPTISPAPSVSKSPTVTIKPTKSN